MSISDMRFSSTSDPEDSSTDMVAFMRFMDLVRPSIFDLAISIFAFDAEVPMMYICSRIMS